MPRVKKIVKREGLCVWVEELDRNEYDVTMEIDLGLKAEYLVNGRLQSTYSHGVSGGEKLNPKKEKREKNTPELIVADTAEISYVWGLGDVPYRHTKTGVETKVGMNGSFSFGVAAARRVCENLGKSEITAQDILEKIRPLINDFGKSELSQKLNSYDHVSIASVQSEMAQNIYKKLFDPMFAMGLELKSFNVAGFYFPEEFLAALKKAEDDKKAEEAAFDAKLEQRRKERNETYRQTMEAENIAKIIKAANEEKDKDNK